LSHPGGGETAMSPGHPDRMSELIDAVLDESRFRTNPYFAALRDGTFSKEDFVETQIQFYFAVTFFSRPMAALAAKIPAPELRIEILRNLWEEHGEGNLGGIHGRTFQEFLSRLANVTADEIHERTLWPEIRIFNTTLAGACLLDEYLIGVALLGVIERMFSEISCWLGQSVTERGWISRERMVHYSLHEKLDIKHAQDFFDVLAPAWEESPDSRYFIEQGLRMGAAVFNGLYDGLYRERSRRMKREVRGPHTRA
jgi:pyrroloquinoline-quinone synthase